MTRAELIAAVQAKGWFLDNIGGIAMEDNFPKTMPNGNTIQLERAHVLVNPVGSDVLYSRYVYFYTIQLGENDEAAYYKDEDVDVQVGIV